MNKLLVIVGETASGKSALAMKLAKKFDGEIIAADAWTVYPGFDVGAAKPGHEDREGIPHHMIDVADPAAGFSAAAFKKGADASIADIQSRGKLPILVGGSGLYIDSVIYDYQFNDRPPADERARLDVMSLTELQELAHSRGLDLTDIDQANKRRVIRLIEHGGAVPGRGQLGDGTLIIGIKPEAEQLHARIEARVDAMLTAGLEAEVRQLAHAYGWDIEAMKGIGYREWRDYLDGSMDIDQVRDLIVQNTTRLSKKQRTWFNRNKSIHWFTTPVIYTDVVDLVTTSLHK